MMYVAVFTGGALGSLLREWLVPVIPVFEPLASTLVVNSVACFAIGWLYAIRHKVHAHVMHLGAVGFCGGLSTFSSYTAALFQLSASGEYTYAAVAATSEIIIGIVAVLLGESLGRRFHTDKTG